MSKEQLKMVNFGTWKIGLYQRESSREFYVPVTSGRELMGTGPQRLTQKLSQSNLLKNSRKR